MMDLLFTVCARAGSKGVKNKNVRMFGGSPLVYRTLSAYDLFKKRFSGVYGAIDLAVNTDSGLLIEQMDATSVDYLYVERKEELAGDRVSKPDVIRDTLNTAKTVNGRDYDAVVDMDLTSPLRTVADIKGVIDLLGDEDTDVSFSMTHSRRLPFFNMVCRDGEGRWDTVIKSDYVSRQQAPECFDMNASLYGYKARFFDKKENIRVLDGHAAGWVMRDTGILDIDEEGDLELLEAISGYFYERFADYREIRDNIAGIMK